MTNTTVPYYRRIPTASYVVRLDAMIAMLTSKATITIEHEEEDTEIEGNASAIDKDTDEATYAWIRRELRAGNSWAWCRVKVTASYAGIDACDYLSGCSYLSEEDFRSGGFDDMRDTAIRALAERIIEIRNATEVG